MVAIPYDDIMMDKNHTEAYRSPSPGEPDTIEYEWNERVAPTTAIVEAIAAATNRDPRHMPPLHDYVDVDSITDIVTTEAKGASRPVRVTFPYEQHTVLVGSDGAIEVRLDTAGER